MTLGPHWKSGVKAGVGERSLRVGKRARKGPAYASFKIARKSWVALRDHLAWGAGQVAIGFCGDDWNVGDILARVEARLG